MTTRAASRAFLLAAALASGAAGCAERAPFPPEMGSEGAAAEGPALERGLAYLRMGETERARKAFIRAVRKGDRPAAALTGAGIAAARQGMLTKAERLFRRASEIAPESVTAHNNLGVILFRQGKHARASQAFRAAYALSSGTSEMARANLALTEKVLSDGTPVQNAAVSHLLERRGSSVYRLTALEAERGEGSS